MGCTEPIALAFAAAKAKELEAEQKLLQAELHESRIAVMISQIQPHFLYNSLAVIQELCYGEPEKAEKAIATHKLLCSNTLHEIAAL